ncbi:hypothetical protein VSS92_27470, partial [Pseudomonas syringae pv. tagetis]
MGWGWVVGVGVGVVWVCVVFGVGGVVVGLGGVGLCVREGEGMGRGVMNFIGVFADESDPQQPCLDSGNGAQAYAEVREAFGRKIQVGTDLL